MNVHQQTFLPCLFLLWTAWPLPLSIQGEVIHESGACYTSGVCGFHQLQCGLRERVAVHRVYYGFKPAPPPRLSPNATAIASAQDKCPAELGPSACERIDTYRCCHLADPQDCVLPYQPHHLDHVLHACAARPACSVQAARSRGLCSDNTRHLSTFSTIQYSCVQEAAVAKFCSDNIVWGSKVSAVLEASQWPLSQLLPGTLCTCVVDSVSGEATSVKLIAMDYRTGGQESHTCTPINVTSPRGQSQIPCDNQNVPMAELGMTLTPARLQLTVGSTVPTRIWVGFDGDQGSLVLRCRQSGTAGGSGGDSSQPELPGVAPGLLNGLQKPRGPSPGTLGTTTGRPHVMDTSTGGSAETMPIESATGSDPSRESPSNGGSPRQVGPPWGRSSLSDTSKPTPSSSTTSSTTPRRRQMPNPTGSQGSPQSGGEISLDEWFREKEFHWTPSPDVLPNENVGQSTTREKNRETISTSSPSIIDSAQSISDLEHGRKPSTNSYGDKKRTGKAANENATETNATVPLTHPRTHMTSSYPEVTVQTGRAPDSKLSHASPEGLPDVSDNRAQGSSSTPRQTTADPVVPTSTAAFSNDRDVVFLIAGSVVGCVVVLVLLLITAACLIRRCRKAPDSQNKRSLPDLGYQFVDMKAAEHVRAKVNLAFDLYQAQHNGRDLAPYTELPTSHSAFQAQTNGTFSQRQVPSSAHYSMARIPDWEPELAPDDSDSSDITGYDRLGHPHPAPRPRAPSCYSQLSLLEGVPDLHSFPTSHRPNSEGNRLSQSSTPSHRKSDSGEEGVYAVIMADDELEASVELGTTPC